VVRRRAAHVSRRLGRRLPITIFLDRHGQHSTARGGNARQGSVLVRRRRILSAPRIKSPKRAIASSIFGRYHHKRRANEPDTILVWYLMYESRCASQRSARALSHSWFAEPIALDSISFGYVDAARSRAAAISRRCAQVFATLV